MASSNRIIDHFTFLYFQKKLKTFRLGAQQCAAPLLLRLHALLLQDSNLLVRYSISCIPTLT